MKKKTVIGVIMIIFSLALTIVLVFCKILACGITTGERRVLFEDKFNSSYIEATNDDMSKWGFKFGDSCNVYFSNGKELLDIPYFDGYYIRSDFPLICGYQGYPYVQITVNNSSDFWQKYELSDDTTVKITLNEKAKYINEQEAFSMVYSNLRSDFESDSVFANFRMINAGDIKDNIIYRGASPFNNTYNRRDYVDKLLKDNNVTYILDLADKIEDYNSYDLVNNYASTQNKSLLNMGCNFRDKNYIESLAGGLKDMINNPGKFYVHCTEGKDRTGFVCALLEGLCNATYDEMARDYMITYENYFNISKNDPKYNAIIKLRFDEFLEYLTGETDINIIKSMNYSKYCRNYLLAGGMTNSEVDSLVDILTK